MLKILIFDSGVGGLSISSSLSNQLPMAEQLLLSDNAFFPYGEMNEKLLIDRVTEVLLRAESELKPDCIIVACNTVSTVALDDIRGKLSIPIIGVVPAIKPAAIMSISKVIGLLATPATIERSYTADLVSDYANDCTLISVGNTRLVEIAEQKLRGQVVDHEVIEKILQKITLAEKEQGLDVLVLGCTHFPLLADNIRQVLPDSISLIDSSDAIARQARAVLEEVAPDKLSEVSVHHETVDSIRHRCLITKQIEDDNLQSGLEEYGFSKPELFL